ncbi:MAG TPA: DNA polymerase ligase N-terminal domain-containing protein [Candidatus Limnocylindria bacterium]|nr:DNA polymerase ligase N-terminal domain-containing protein [Candidatus Limnocylindria bacterium]
MSLRDYVRKRRFDVTPEPRGRERKRHGGLYVIQKHRASHLHYDFRLEAEGVLRSWSVPKGPSTDPAVRRLAMEVEDHPVEYGSFEGTIPEGEYGGGTVMLWDTGTYELEDGTEWRSAYRTGRIRFTLNGKKLKGTWSLARMRGRQWLLHKSKGDRYASTDDITLAKPRSVVSRRLLAGIAKAHGGDVEKAATGDPAPRP